MGMFTEVRHECPPCHVCDKPTGWGGVQFKTGDDECEVYDKHSAVTAYGEARIAPLLDGEYCGVTSHRCVVDTVFHNWHVKVQGGVVVSVDECDCSKADDGWFCTWER